MAYLPRPLKALVDALSAIQETIQNYAQAIHAANEGKEQQEEVGKKWRDEILTEYKKAEGNRTTSDERQYSVQNSLRWATWCAFIAAVAAAYGAFHYASIAADQLTEMRRTNCLTQKALANSDNALKQTLGKMQGQIDATNNYSVVAAGAYLTAYGAHVDANSKSVFVNVLNIGHLAADGEMTFFEMIVNRGEQTKFTVGFPIGKMLDGYWATSTFLAATYVNPPLIRYPLPKFSPPDYAQGKMAVIVSGKVTYRDGFPQTSAHTIPYCWISFQNLQTNQQDGIPCDEQRMTARIKKAIGFPSGKMPEP